MTEERIEELLRPIIAKLFDWSVRVRRPSYGTIEGFVQSTFKSTLYTVAAESREEGIEEMRDEARRIAGSNLMLFADINAGAKRLKEQG